jgi:beta-1,4-mannosyl-glycoprotein beta-1,4-N-acetylglucosaminyltransferase
MFCDELDVFKLRLGQLDSIVDWFVINEISTTHSGKPKPLYYQENKHLFSKWNHKIICSSPSFPPMGAWELETAQRQALEASVRSLNPQPDDVLLTSDCDEIPKPERIKEYTPSMGLRNLKQFTFWFNFGHMMNYGSRCHSRARIGTIRHLNAAGSLSNFHGSAADDMDPNFPSLEDAGWHCSYFADSPMRVRRKVNSFAHEDLQHIVNRYTDRQLADIMINGKDLYGRADIPAPEHWSENDSRLPSYFLQNKEIFRGFRNEGFREMNNHLFDSGDQNVAEVHPRLSRF